MITRERGIAIMLALLFGVIAFVYGLRSLEWHMTFHPVPLDSTRRQPPPGATNVWFTTADGVHLHGWFFENQTTTATLVFFHGNTGNIGDVDWLGQRFHERGFNVLLFDYRGYGASEGEESETGLYADGDAAVAFLINEKRVRPDQIILYGQSLGTTVVADVASRRDLGAVILESGPSSASSMAGHALPWLPQRLHFLGKNRFESAQKLAKVKAPVLISHGDPDPVVPTSEGRLLYAAANEPKRLLIFPGAGHNVFGSAGDSYLNQLIDFINQSLKDSADVTARR